MRKNLILAILISIAFFSCKKDKPAEGSKTLPTDSTARVLVVCEGSLGNGNCELNVYFPFKENVFNDVFRNANAQDLGDVFQSITKFGGQYFLCVNNSDKIAVIDRTSFKQYASISVPKPRYIFASENDKAYVGSLFSNKIYEINTLSFSVSNVITMPYQNAEGMLIKDGFAYVCCWDTACNKLYQVQLSANVITDSISLAGVAPQSILLDKENNIWVMGGNAYKGKSASLSKIDLKTKKLVQSFVFGKGVEAIKPCLNPTKDSLYFLEVDYNGGAANNGVFRMNINDSKLPSTAFIACKTNQYFWALGIDPASGKIYVGDPKGFTQKGSVSIYDAQGNLQKQFGTNLGPGAFYFD